ncbi:MAG: DUF4838 domain-containing protein [Lentisphaerae bacterium]|nr:DUF4838 domain-containing protein [Lentisphaerota bacterium]
MNRTIKGGSTEQERKNILIGFLMANRDVKGFQYEYGTVNAVYTFLQDNLGVRWLWPGNDGEVVPKQVKIVLKPFEFRYYPKIRMRSGVFCPIAIYKQGGDPYVDSGAWVRRQRVQLDSFYAPTGGHGFGNWYDRFYKDHPDYFALQPDGTRECRENKTSMAKNCQSNPAVVEQWLKDVEECIAVNPHRTVFNAAANDGYGSGMCICEKCRAWDSPEGEKRIWNYPGDKVKSKIEGVALSDREVTFANILARKLKERYPGKDYKVLIIAYGYTRPAPIKAIPEDNVIIANCANCFSNPNGVDSSSPIGTKSIDQFDAWAKLTKNQIWRPNTGDHVRWQTGGPPAIRGAGEIFKRMGSKDIIGIWIDQVWFYWATQGPEYYIMAQLAWNPSGNIDEIMDDYYKSGFGPAAEDIKAYWTMLENNRAEQMSGKKSWLEAFSPEFFKTTYALLDKSAEKTAKAGKEYSDRVAFVRAGLDYLRLNTENQALVKQIIQSKTPNPALKAKMQANWNQIEEISKKHPEALGQIIRADYIRPNADHKAIEEKRLKKAAAAARKKKNMENLVEDTGLE